MTGLTDATAADGGVIQRQLDTDREDPAAQLVEVIADIDGVEPMELAPIYYRIDGLITGLFSSPLTPRGERTRRVFVRGLPYPRPSGRHSNGPRTGSLTRSGIARDCAELVPKPFSAIRPDGYSSRDSGGINSSSGFSPHMDAYELLTRNAEEVVTDEEVRDLAAEPEGKRAYVGYEPSGVLHLGHLLTANKLIDPPGSGDGGRRLAGGRPRLPQREGELRGDPGHRRADESPVPRLRPRGGPDRVRLRFPSSSSKRSTPSIWATSSARRR